MKLNANARLKGRAVVATTKRVIKIGAAARLAQVASAWWDSLTPELKLEFVTENPDSKYAQVFKGEQNDTQVHTQQAPQAPGTEPAPTPASPANPPAGVPPTPAAQPGAPADPKAPPAEDDADAPPPADGDAPDDTDTETDPPTEAPTDGQSAQDPAPVDGEEAPAADPPVAPADPAVPPTGPAVPPTDPAPAAPVAPDPAVPPAADPAAPAAPGGQPPPPAADPAPLVDPVPTPQTDGSTPMGEATPAAPPQPGEVPPVVTPAPAGPAQPVKPMGQRTTNVLQGLQTKMHLMGPVDQQFYTSGGVEPNSVQRTTLANAVKTRVAEVVQHITTTAGPTAGAALKKLVAGQPMDENDKHVVKSVAQTIAITVNGMAVSANTPPSLSAAISFMSVQILRDSALRAAASGGIQYAAAPPFVKKKGTEDDEEGKDEGEDALADPDAEDEDAVNPVADDAPEDGTTDTTSPATPAPANPEDPSAAPAAPVAPAAAPATPNVDPEQAPIPAPLPVQGPAVDPAGKPLDTAPVVTTPEVPAANPAVAPIDPANPDPAATTPPIPDPVVPVGGGDAGAGGDPATDPAAAVPDPNVTPDPNATNLGTEGDAPFFTTVMVKYADFIQKGDIPDDIWVTSGSQIADRHVMDNYRIESMLKQTAAVKAFDKEGFAPFFIKALEKKN